jgi:hypothetical protein
MNFFLACHLKLYLIVPDLRADFPGANLALRADENTDSYVQRRPPAFTPHKILRLSNNKKSGSLWLPQGKPTRSIQVSRVFFYEIWERVAAAPAESILSMATIRQLDAFES